MLHELVTLVSLAPAARLLLRRQLDFISRKIDLYIYTSVCVRACVRVASVRVCRGEGVRAKKGRERLDQGVVCMGNESKTVSSDLAVLVRQTYATRYVRKRCRGPEKMGPWSSYFSR